MRLFPSPEPVVDSTVESSGRFCCCCCSSTFAWPTSASWTKKYFPSHDMLVIIKGCLKHLLCFTMSPVFIASTFSLNDKNIDEQSQYTEMWRRMVMKELKPKITKIPKPSMQNDKQLDVPKSLKAKETQNSLCFLFFLFFQIHHVRDKETTSKTTLYQCLSRLTSNMQTNTAI